MIRFTLTCANKHRFESWFASNAAYDSLRKAGHLSCPVCGMAEVEKMLMAPAVRPGKAAALPPGTDPRQGTDPRHDTDPRQGTDPRHDTGPRHDSGPGPQAARPMIAAPSADVAEKLAALRRHVEANADYVGPRFAEEARRMHLGDAPERAIYGDANPGQVRALIEDGVPIAPLPFIPKAKTN